jgi:hypothetical protein
MPDKEEFVRSINQPRERKTARIPPNIVSPMNQISIFRIGLIIAACLETTRATRKAPLNANNVVEAMIIDEVKAVNSATSFIEALYKKVH